MNMEPLSRKRQKVFFLSFVGPNYSRSSTLLNFKDDRFDKIFFKFPSGVTKAIFEMIKRRSELRLAACIVIMSPCHILAPLAKVIVGRPTILDAGWPISDGHISRGLKHPRIFRLPQLLLIDLVSFLSADIVLMESENQLRRTKRKFRLSESKLKVSFTGFDESPYFSKSVDSDLMLRLQKEIARLNHSTVVLFRGKVNNESGFELIEEAARNLQNQVTFILLLGKQDLIRNFSQNVIPLAEVSAYEMEQIYDLSDIAVGQVSVHPRLSYTIPHKAYEAGFFGIPYITSKAGGILEIFDPESVIFLSNSSTCNLIEAIKILEDPLLRIRYAANIHKDYVNSISQSKINENFARIVNTLISTRVGKAL